MTGKDWAPIGGNGTKSAASVTGKDIKIILDNGTETKDITDQLLIDNKFYLELRAQWFGFYDYKWTDFYMKIDDPDSTVENFLLGGALVKVFFKDVPFFVGRVDWQNATRRGRYLSLKVTQRSNVEQDIAIRGIWPVSHILEQFGYELSNKLIDTERFAVNSLGAISGVVYCPVEMKGLVPWTGYGDFDGSLARVFMPAVTVNVDGTKVPIVLWAMVNLTVGTGRIDDYQLPDGYYGKVVLFDQDSYYCQPTDAEILNVKYLYQDTYYAYFAVEFIRGEAVGFVVYRMDKNTLTAEAVFIHQNPEYPSDSAWVNMMTGLSDGLVVARKVQVSGNDHLFVTTYDWNDFSVVDEWDCGLWPSGNGFSRMAAIDTDKFFLSRRDKLVLFDGGVWYDIDTDSGAGYKFLEGYGSIAYYEKGGNLYKTDASKNVVLIAPFEPGNQAVGHSQVSGTHNLILTGGKYIYAFDDLGNKVFDVELPFRKQALNMLPSVYLSNGNALIGIANSETPKAEEYDPDGSLDKFSGVYIALIAKQFEPAIYWKPEKWEYLEKLRLADVEKNIFIVRSAESEAYKIDYTGNDLVIDSKHIFDFGTIEYTYKDMVEGVRIKFADDYVLEVGSGQLIEVNTLMPIENGAAVAGYVSRMLNRNAEYRVKTDILPELFDNVTLQFPDVEIQGVVKGIRFLESGLAEIIVQANPVSVPPNWIDPSQPGLLGLPSVSSWNAQVTAWGNRLIKYVLRAKYTAANVEFFDITWIFWNPNTIRRHRVTRNAGEFLLYDSTSLERTQFNAQSYAVIIMAGNRRYGTIFVDEIKGTQPYPVEWGVDKFEQHHPILQKATYVDDYTATIDDPVVASDAFIVIKNGIVLNENEYSIDPDLQTLHFTDPISDKDFIYVFGTTKNLEVF